MKGAGKGQQSKGSNNNGTSMCRPICPLILTFCVVAYVDGVWVKWWISSPLFTVSSLFGLSRPSASRVEKEDCSGNTVQEGKIHTKGRVKGIGTTSYNSTDMKESGKMMDIVQCAC